MANILFFKSLSTLFVTISNMKAVFVIVKARQICRTRVDQKIMDMMTHSGLKKGKLMQYFVEIFFFTFQSYFAKLA